jgi:uncharacterized protein with HEPN domain
MRRPDEALLADMRDAARRIQSRLGAVTRSAFDDNEDLQLALAYLIQVIGEAASRLGEDQRRAFPAVPWRDIIGMRHVIVHNYFSIDLDVLWDTATNSIPSLIAALAPPPVTQDSDDD